MFTDDVIAQYSEDPARFKLWLEASGNRPDDLSELESLAEVEQDTFMGEYPNPADYAQETSENSYYDELENLPEHIRWCIDWDALWHGTLRHQHHYIRNTDYNTLIWAEY